MSDIPTFLDRFPSAQPSTTAPADDRHANCSSLLDHQESAVAAAPPLLSDQLTPWKPELGNWPGHAHWQDRRRLILDALLRTAPLNRRCVRFAFCAQSFWAYRHVTNADRFVLVRDFCHDRFCDVCSRRRAWTIRCNLRPLLGERDYRLISLTLRHNATPLTAQLNHLYASFRRLRTTAAWKAHVRGGVAFLELGRNAETGRWHPHLHCVTFGTWFPAAVLKLCWRFATGDSDVIDIRFVEDPETVATYVCKYATKSLPESIASEPAALDEAVVALHSRKLLVLFGEAKHWQLLKTTPLPDFKFYGHLHKLPEKTAADKELARELKLMASMITDHEIASEIIFHDPEFYPPQQFDDPQHPIPPRPRRQYIQIELDWDAT
jgi:hypothetical protein